VLRRLLWESRRGPGADSPEKAVIAIHDPAPIQDFLKRLPLDSVQNGVLRGLYAKAAFHAAYLLNDLGRLPENDHAIWLPQAGWRAIERLVDPLERLTASWRRICDATQVAGAERAARLEMERILVEQPIRFGARLTEPARGKLEARA